jgi:hypothetical protein
MMDIVGNAEKPSESAICQLDSARFVQQKETLSHAVKQCVLLGLELVEGVKLNVLELLNLTPGSLLRFDETAMPPEMNNRQRRQSENC